MTEQLVRGISKADFDSWRHHPVTKVVLEVLAAKQRIIKETVLSKFVAGDYRLGSDEASSLRGQIIEIEEILGMRFENVAAIFEEANDRAGEHEPTS